MPKPETISGKLPRDLGQSVSDAIYKACTSGMSVDEAASVVVAVAADYWRDAYGAQTVGRLAEVIKDRASHNG